MIFRCPRCGQTSLLDGLCAECAKGRRYVTKVPKTEGPATLLSDVSVQDVPRLTMPGFPALDDSLHGGFVRGSALLLHGGPGIGKSTLALQLCGRIGRLVPSLYVTTEQMLAHVKMLADRVEVQMDVVYALATQNFADVVTSVERLRPAFVVIDALQNLNLFEPYDGNRMVAVCNGLVRLARQQTCAVVIVCHETKDETFAGPRTLEHVVDGMVSLSAAKEDESSVLWTVYSKYRFGPVPYTVALGQHSHGGFYERYHPAHHTGRADGDRSPRIAAEGTEGAAK